MNYVSKQDRDFISLVAKKAEATEGTTKLWWNAIFEAIVEELYLRGSIRLPGIGDIKTVLQEETVYKRKDAKGNDTYYYAPERYLPTMRFQYDFTDDINMRGVTGVYRKRLHRGTLTMRDRDRERRAEKMQTTEGQITEAKAEVAKSAFAEKLKQKADESAAKIEENNGKK